MQLFFKLLLQREKVNALPGRKTEFMERERVL